MSLDRHGIQIQFPHPALPKKVIWFVTLSDKSLYLYMSSSEVQNFTVILYNSQYDDIIAIGCE